MFRFDIENGGRISLLGLCCLFILVSCTGSPPPVQLQGPDAQSALLGEWFGSYGNPQGRRSGTIWFVLTEGGVDASGEVVMIPDEVSKYPSGGIEPSRAEWERLRPQALEISFVRVSGNRVTGMLQPYRDPECGCLLRTTFEGEIDGDTIRGTFLSEGEERSHIPQRGEWEVTRRARMSP